jgi:nucleotide-binding universal stress UspA family protein
MIKTILLVLDGQDADHASIDLVLRWSSDFGATLVGLGLLDESLVNPPEPVPLGGAEAKRTRDAARMNKQRQAVEHSRAAIAARCAQENVPFKPFDPVGLPVEEVAGEAQRYDLIVVPRPEPDDTDSIEEGSTAALWAILRATPRPVVAVPAQATPGKSIVIAYDGSLQAARAVQAFESSGLAAKHPLYVVAIDDDPEEAARRGSRAIDFLACHDRSAKLHTVTCTSSPSEHLMETAQSLNAGLIVMGAYGRRRIFEFFLGSVTRAMLAECPIPLFLYH